MEVKAEVWEPGESSGGFQNLFRTFKGDFLEEAAFEVELKACTGVCQLKKGICRRAFNAHSLNRCFTGPRVNRALGWPTSGAVPNSVSL